MVKFENRSVITDYVRAETEEPSPQKQDGDRTVYLSRNNFGYPRLAPGMPTIADFGLAVWGQTSDYFNHAIQPDCFGAPEIILGAGWIYRADIWNLGVLVMQTACPTSPHPCGEAKPILRETTDLGPSRKKNALPC